MHVQFILLLPVHHDVRLKGSTLVTNGVITAGSDEWAIYGGTGVFAMARGVIKRKYLADRTGGNTDEFTMDVFCRAFGGSQQPNKVCTVTEINLWSNKTDELTNEQLACM